MDFCNIFSFWVPFIFKNRCFYRCCARTLKLLDAFYLPIFLEVRSIRDFLQDGSLVIRHWYDPRTIISHKSAVVLPKAFANKEKWSVSEPRMLEHEDLVWIPHAAYVGGSDGIICSDYSGINNFKEKQVFFTSLHV